MGHNTHEDVARRWAQRILSPGRDALRSNNLHDVGDSINSYGSHFEVGRVLRDQSGQPIGWLLNGDRWPGVVTTRHQNEVLRAVTGSGLPRVTIPHQALDAASIDIRTIEIIDVQADWWTSRVITKLDRPNSWQYEYDYSDKGGWVNSLTGEFVARTGYAYDHSEKPKIVCECTDQPGLIGPWSADPYNWTRSAAQRSLDEAHIRARHGVWDDVRGHVRNTGRKTPMATKHTPWEMVHDADAPLGYVFERTVQRHWLGGSLIKAQVPYTVRVKHPACGGTGVAAEKWYTHVWRGQGVGPLTEPAMREAEYRAEILMERNGGMPQLLRWEIEAYDEHTECRGCGGSGRANAQRRRTAHFLSGFDENETRPSYFFCELPPKVTPTTVDEALEMLKPQAVILAEQAGRDVKRQGDIFAIPMPGLTLRELKEQGGRLEKRGNLLGTNHAATEVVYVGRQTYARGTISHVPEFRRPDHKRLTIGREWHLIQKNTVPVSA